MGNLKKLQKDGVDILPIVPESHTFDSNGNSISDKYALQSTVNEQMANMSTQIINKYNELANINNNKIGNGNDLISPAETVVGAINNIYTQRDNVKQQLVTALSEKGVSASTSESIESLINKIQSIQTGNDIPEWYIPTNPYSDTWNRAAASSYSNLWPGEYHYLETNTMTAVNDKIYCIGGTFYTYDGDNEYNELNIVCCYDIKTNQWTKLSNYTAGTVSGHSATYVNGYIYVIGGYVNFDTSNEKYGLVYRYNVSTGQWGSRRSMTYATASHRAEAIGTNIYTFGGYEEFTDTYDNNQYTHMYSTTGNTWTMKSRTTPFNGSYNHTIASGVINNTIYVFSQELGKVYSYNSTTDTWTEKATLMDGDDYSFRPHGTVYNNKLYLISVNMGVDGGYEGYNMAYDPVLDAVTNKSMNLTPNGNYGLYISGGDAVTASDGCIYTICNYGDTYCYIP